jgi:hypothetical protein
VRQQGRESASDDPALILDDRVPNQTGCHE